MTFELILKRRANQSFLEYKEEPRTAKANSMSQLWGSVLWEALRLFKTVNNEKGSCKCYLAWLPVAPTPGVHVLVWLLSSEWGQSGDLPDADPQNTASVIDIVLETRSCQVLTVSCWFLSNFFVWLLWGGKITWQGRNWEWLSITLRKDLSLANNHGASLEAYLSPVEPADEAGTSVNTGYSFPRVP